MSSSFNSVSSRAQKLIKPPLAYTAEVIKSITNQYSSANESGSVLMAVAENKLCSSQMIEKMLTLKEFPNEMLNYTMSTGGFALRKTMAKFLSKYLFDGHPVDDNNLVITPGCCSALIQLSLLLFEAGDSVLIPTPFYPAFIADFINFGEVNSVGIIGENVDEQHVFGLITINSLNVAYEKAMAAGHPPKAVLLTNPSNPVGTLLSNEELLTVISWCAERKIHLISDEIYALSMFYKNSGGEHPSNDVDTPLETDTKDRMVPFTSVVSLLNNVLTDYVHVAWSVSKDFGCSGVRLGVLYTQNQSLLQAMSNTNDAMQVSNIAQEIVNHVLSDTRFIDNYLVDNRKKLWHSYHLLQSHFETIGIKVVPAVSGIFAFCDFRCFLQPENVTFEAEFELFQELTKRGVVFTPGQSCHCPIPGFFRVCYAYVPVNALMEGIRRVTEYYSELQILRGQKIENNV